MSNNKAFKYDGQGCIWEDVPPPYENDCVGDFDGWLYAKKQYDSRLSFTVPKEYLPTLSWDTVQELIEGIHYELFECDLCDGCGWYEGGKTLRTHCTKCDGNGAVAIPLPIDKIKTKREIWDKILAENRGVYSYYILEQVMEEYESQFKMAVPIPAPQPLKEGEQEKYPVQYCEGEDDIAFDFHEANSQAPKEGEKESDRKWLNLVETAFKHPYKAGRVHPGNNMNKDWEQFKKDNLPKPPLTNKL